MTTTKKAANRLDHEKQDEAVQAALRLLGLRHLEGTWEERLADAQNTAPPYRRFLTEIILEEAADKRERQRQSRIRRAKIPELRLMQTFPFERQPMLRKKFVMDLFEGLEFMRKPQDLVYIGPTGCGKTGLATAFLVHALDNGYRGYWTDFKDLLDTLWRSIGDHSEKRVVRRFAEIDCLVIDELGYAPIRKEQAGLFFDLMKRRHHKKTTLITTQLGYDEWADFLQNKHLTAALLDRMTENCTVFDMKRCISIRPKNVRHATRADGDESDAE